MTVVLRVALALLVARASGEPLSSLLRPGGRLAFTQRTLQAVAPAHSSHKANVTSLASVDAGRVLAQHARLRLCNAHPAGPMSASMDKGQTILASNIPFGTCREHVGPLRVNDFITFQIGELETGIFIPHEPLRDDGVVLFVINEADTKTHAMGRKLMFLRPLKYPQVVGVNVAPGSDSFETSFVRLVPKEGQNFNEDEDLEYDQIRPIDPGNFVVQIVGKGNSTIAQAPLRASMGESYVLMRIGEKSLLVSNGGAPPLPPFFGMSSTRHLGLLGMAAALASFFESRG